MNLPNAISFARLLSVPVFIWLVLTERLEAAFWLFVAAGISDAVDGILAKRLKMRTELGAYLDPIADKVLLVTGFIALGYRDAVPLWLVILVVSRDVLIVGGALMFETMTKSLTMEPLMISKANTVAQLTLIAAVLLPAMFGTLPEPVVTSLCTIVAVTTVSSGAAYVFIWSNKASAMTKTSYTPTKDPE